MVYETLCLTCERREDEKIYNDEDDEKRKKEKKKTIMLYIYVGETSRSLYERGLEHQNDCQEMKKDSHMITHYLNIG